MDLIRSRLSLIVACLLLAACAGPRSAVEVYHLRDLVQEGQVEHLSDLTAALGASDESVRSAAIRSLAELGPVAIPRLRQTVREESKRSGPALLALGFSGEAEVVEFVREYKKHPTLSADAIEAERELERQLYARISKGDFEAMEAYLEVFPDSPKVAEIKQARRERLAKQAFERARASDSPQELEAFLEQYADSEDAPMVRVMLARMLVKEAAASIEAQEYEKARQTVARVPEFDPRREAEAKRIVAQSFLAEGKALRVAGKDTEALAALEKAAEFPEFRIEASRIQADIVMVQGRARLDAGTVQQGVALLEKASQLDPLRKPEVANLKSNLIADFQTKIQGDDPVARRLGLVGMISMGDEAAKSMEIYLGKLFAQKDYAKVEEVVQALSSAKMGTPPGQVNPGIDRIGGLLISYLKASLQASTGEVIRLFGSPDFLRYWKAEVDPIDPRQYPLIYKVEGATVRHLGLSRIALAAKALLDDKTIQISEGSLLPEEEIQGRISRGEVGNDPTLPLLTRVQLCARYSYLLAEFNRLVESKPERFIEYAVGLSLPPYTTADWLQVAEGFKRAVANAGPDGRLDTSASRGGLRAKDATLVSLDYDQRSLTVLVYDPVVDRLGSKTQGARAEAAQRTLAMLLNSARIAFGLYAGVDRFTVMIGSTERPQESDSRVRGGQFDPETRMMLSRKFYDKIDWATIRNQNGTYTARELNMIDLKWYRWEK